jgi:hypothetical protein
MKRKSHPEFRGMARTMRPRQDDGQAGSNPKLRFADHPRTGLVAGYKGVLAVLT